MWLLYAESELNDSEEELTPAVQRRVAEPCSAVGADAKQQRLCFLAGKVGNMILGTVCKNTGKLQQCH